MIDARTLLMWLAGISENKVSPEVRPKLAKYQNEVADVLEAHFSRRLSEPAPSQPQHIDRPWYARVTTTLVPHILMVERDFPGHFTIPSALQTLLVSMEQLLHEFLVPTGCTDRPDVSVGLRFNRHRRDVLKLPEVTATAPLFLAEQGITVAVNLYPNAERPDLFHWLGEEYLPDLYLKYADNKPEFKDCGRHRIAACIDATCKKLTGRPARLPEKRRVALQMRRAMRSEAGCLAVAE